MLHGAKIRGIYSLVTNNAKHGQFGWVFAKEKYLHLRVFESYDWSGPHTTSSIAT